MYDLLVTQPFGQRAVGHHITDPKEVEAVLKGPYARNVVKSFAPAPQPQAIPDDEPAKPVVTVQAKGDPDMPRPSLSSKSSA